MEPSSRRLKVDLEKHTVKEENYVVQFNGPKFLQAPTIDELKTMCTDANDGVSHDLFVSIDDSFVSGQLKVLISVSDRIYHFMSDNLPLLLKLHKDNPDIHFMLYFLGPDKTDGKLYEFLFNLLNHLGISYTKIYKNYQQVYSPVYRMSNYLNTDESSFNLHDSLSFLDVQYALDVVMQYSRGRRTRDEVKPYRKVYLSRRHLSGDLGVEPERLSDNGYCDDKRMDDDSKLEELFENAGYETLIPEHKFSTFEEQIAYMMEVETLVSITSSGLTNMLFMNDGGIVVDIKAETVAIQGHVDDGLIIVTKQAVPFEFEQLAYLKRHLYIGIPSRRVADEVVDAIKSRLGWLLEA